jgi:chemotaxis protein MotB
MRVSYRLLVCAGLCVALTAATGCGMVPRRALAVSQNRARQLWEQNQALAMEKDALSRQLGDASVENGRLQAQIADLNSNSSMLQSRLDNLMSERNAWQTRTISSSPLSGDVTHALEDLVRKYPEFEFDPQTGVSKFQTDILFDTGSDALKPNAAPLLRDFAAIMNKASARDLHVLVVGHTDNRRVAKPQTKAKHPDNMYLSTNRAHAVRKALQAAGLSESRFGAAGYGPYQPVAANADPKGRERNRRVEIFVMAPANGGKPNAAAISDDHQVSMLPRD